MYNLKIDYLINTKQTLNRVKIFTCMEPVEDTKITTSNGKVTRYKVTTPSSHNPTQLIALLKTNRKIFCFTSCVFI